MALAHGPRRSSARSAIQIIKSEGNTIRNLTTAASIWFAAAIGMVIGLGWYLVGAMATAYAVLVPRIPHVKTWVKVQQDE